MNRVLMAAAVLSLAALSTEEGLSQYSLRKHAMGSGGGGGAGGGMIVTGTIGQATAGLAAEGRASIGFWSPIGRIVAAAEIATPGLAATAMTLHALPNPFTTGTDIRIVAPPGASISLSLHDDLGRRVMTPVDGERMTGSARTVRIDAGDLPSGRYTATLVSGSERRAIQLLLVR